MAINIAACVVGVAVIAPAPRLCATPRVCARNLPAGTKAALMDVHVEHGRRRRDSLLQRFPRFGGAAELAKCGGEPAICIGIMRS